MAELFAGGRIVDCVVLLMFLEFIVLTLLHVKAGRGIKPVELGATLSAGMAMLFALRAALVGLPWQQVSIWLTVALVAHVVYLTVRWSAP